MVVESRADQNASHWRRALGDDDSRPLTPQVLKTHVHRYEELYRLAQQRHGHDDPLTQEAASKLHTAVRALADATSSREPATLYAALSSWELIADLDGLTSMRLAVVNDGADETFLRLLDMRIDPLRRDLSRRMRLHQAGRGPNPVAGRLPDLMEVTRRVRDAVDPVTAIALAGHPWTAKRVNRDGSMAGKCPLCGGDDRFVMWTAGNGRSGWAWCRRGDFSGDAISLYQALANVTFAAAVHDLADFAGITIPAPTQADVTRAVNDARVAQGERQVTP